MKIIVALLAATLTSTLSAFSVHRIDAPVVGVTPIIEQHCETSFHHPGHSTIVEQPRSRTSPIVGAIVGGALGSQIGDGDGRDAAVIAGAALGYGIVRDTQEQNRRHAIVGDSSLSQRCFQVTREYVVTYRTPFGLAETRMSHRPGRFVRVRVEMFVEGH